MAETVSEQKIELQERTDDISNQQNTANEYTHPGSNRNVLTMSKMVGHNDYDAIKQTSTISEQRTFFGNDASIMKPHKLGKTRALLYIKDFPVITIGPNCM